MVISKEKQYSQKELFAKEKLKSHDDSSSTQPSSVDSDESPTVYTKKSERERIGDYTIGKILAEGAFGIVKLGKNIKTNELVAIKIVDKEQTEKRGATELIEREISILKRVKHPNIIECFQVIETEYNWYMVMEYVSGGELFDYVTKRGSLSEYEASSFFSQIISGIEYLHTEGIYHRDLKLENIMLDKDNKVKIIDFGYAAIDEGKLLKRFCGTAHYIAPDVLTGPYNGSKADIWSCGIIFYAMVTGKLPFANGSEDAKVIFEQIKHTEVRLPPYLSDKCKDLISSLLHKDPIERITVPNIRRHAFSRIMNFYKGSINWRQKKDAILYHGVIPLF